MIPKGNQHDARGGFMLVELHVAIAIIGNLVSRCSLHQQEFRSPVQREQFDVGLTAV